MGGGFFDIFVLLNPLQYAAGISLLGKIYFSISPQLFEFVAIVADHHPHGFTAEHLFIISGIPADQKVAQGDFPFLTQITNSLTLGGSERKDIQIPVLRVDEVITTSILEQSLMNPC